MIEFKNIEGLYFVGIENRMSALALYFAKGGYSVAGYDRSESEITVSLIENGCNVTYKDDLSTLPDLFRNISDKKPDYYSFHSSYSCRKYNSRLFQIKRISDL